MDENVRRPGNPRRRRKTQMEIIKEAYLPTIILIVTVIFIIIFIAGSLSRRAAADKLPPVNNLPSTDPVADIHAVEAERLLTEANQLALNYDYQAALELLMGFTGDLHDFPEISAKLEEYRQTTASLVSWDASQITTLSFHTLIADPARAFTNEAYGTAYNKNFVTTSEFREILQQLYDNGYVLVRLSDYSTMTTEDGGRVVCSTNPLQLPLGKKPLLLVQTNVNYYTYMVDGDGDGLPDEKGAGFASRLMVDESGKITCEMVDSSGNTVTGSYDLVPILNDFLAEHPDFSYRGAKAILAPSGYDGVFGYRTNPAMAEKKGEAFYNAEVNGAKALVSALREDGWDIACYTYGNKAYGKLGAADIQAELRQWADEVSPILGTTNILVFAQDSELEEYSGSKFNVLQNAGFRYYLGFTTGSSGSQVGSDYLVQKRLTVSGSQMAHTNLFANMFDASTILDSIRGDIPK